VVDMPLIYDRTTLKRPLEKVIPLKEFMKICLALMKDEVALNALCGMIDHSTQEREFHTTQRVVNQVLRKKRRSDEFRLIVQIGAYDINQVI
jgi:hypothetical protein